MPMRLKVQYLTSVEKQCIGCLGNGMRASTAVALPHPLVSGERVSIWVNQPQAKGGGTWPEEPHVGGRQCPFGVSSLYLL